MIAFLFFISWSTCAYHEESRPCLEWHARLHPSPLSPSLSLFILTGSLHLRTTLISLWSATTVALQYSLLADWFWGRRKREEMSHACVGLGHQETWLQPPPFPSTSVCRTTRTPHSLCPLLVPTLVDPSHPPSRSLPVDTKTRVGMDTTTPSP
jgi:hypothetical protein